MKTFLILCMLLVAGPSITFAQNHPNNSMQEHKIESLYIAYISKELKLTESEAEKFWPVHNEYDSELKASSTTLSELDRQQAVLNIKKKYQPRFSKIIGAERTDQFFKVDGEFRKKLLERIRKSRKQQEPGLMNRPHP